MSDVEADLLIGLRALAKIPDGRQSFTFQHDAMRIEVDYVGGSSSRLTLTSRYDLVAWKPVPKAAAYRKSATDGTLHGIRPMLVTLREESADDREAKAGGLSREHQTGDEEFDRAIYIDSPTTSAELLGGVLSEGVRAAVLELFALGFEPIVIDDAQGDVTATVSRFGKLAVEQAAERVIEAFTKMLSNLPPVAPVAGEHPKRSVAPKVLAIMGAISLVVGAPLVIFGVASAYDCTEGSADGEGTSLKDGCGGPALVALLGSLVAGFLVMLVIRRAARSRVAGHSDSHKRLSYVAIAAFMWSALVTLIIAVLLGYSSRV